MSSGDRQCGIPQVWKLERLKKGGGEQKCLGTSEKGECGVMVGEEKEMGGIVSDHGIRD